MALQTTTSFETDLENLFEELIAQQREKTLQTAQRHDPHITSEDILNPNDFPRLMTDPVFNYEEGLTAGLLTAQMAIRVRLLQPLKKESQTTSGQS